SFAGYVLTTVKHLAYRHSKTTAQTVAVGDGAAWEQLRQATDPAAAADDVTAAWASLPPRWRAVLWLIEGERYPPAELADALSMPPNAVPRRAPPAGRARRAAFARGGAGLLPRRHARRPGRRSWRWPTRCGHARPPCGRPGPDASRPSARRWRALRRSRD